MAGRYVRVTDEGAVKVVTIDRPEVLNAIDEAVLEELWTTWDALDADPETRVIILTGAGEKAFVAGGDIGAMYRLSPMEAERFVYAGHRVLNRIERSRQVVIAAVNGYALGGGTELALACDIRVAAAHAVFGLPEVTIGLFPGWGGTQRLARLVGEGRAKELVLTGERISAEEAYRIGLVNRVVPGSELMDACRQLAAKILAASPIGVRQAKKAIHEGLQVSLDQGLAIEAEAWLVNFATEDRREGLGAFLEKRKPQFRGR